MFRTQQEPYQKGRLGVLDLIMGCYCGIRGAMSNFSHTYEPSSTVNLLPSPKHPSLCASHLCQHPFFLSRIFFSSFLAGEENANSSFLRVSSYFLCVVTIYCPPATVLGWCIPPLSQLPWEVSALISPFDRCSQEPPRGSAKDTEPAAPPRFSLARLLLACTYAITGPLLRCP